MSRHVLFVILLATGIALADNKPGAEHAAEAQAKTEASQRPIEGAQPGTEEKQEQTEEAQEPSQSDGSLISVPGGTPLGMSILGNQDAPKSLVIVPWKSSQLGDSRGISPLLDDSKQPVDREVFMRALRYYEIRSGKKP